MTDGAAIMVANRARKFLGKARDGVVRRGTITQKEALKIMDAAINILRMVNDHDPGEVRPSPAEVEISFAGKA